MAVAAHQDDQLLFMAPDLQHDIAAGRCVRLVGLSSGAHTNVPYMLSRESGMEAAYAQAAGVPDAWTTRYVRQAHHWIAEVILDGNPRVSIDFLRLDTNDAWQPGGNPANGDPSLLEALERGWTPTLRTIDGPQTYTRAQLVAALAQLMGRFAPDRVDTQDFTERYGPGDHADHRATGFLTRAAWRIYGQGVLVDYQGYDMAPRSINVLGADYEAKLDAFLAYEPGDPLVPQGLQATIDAQYYGNWLGRQYSLQRLVVPRKRPRH